MGRGESEEESDLGIWVSGILEDERAESLIVQVLGCCSMLLRGWGQETARDAKSPVCPRVAVVRKYRWYSSSLWTLSGGQRYRNREDTYWYRPMAEQKRETATPDRAAEVEEGVQIITWYNCTWGVVGCSGV